jgi:hypothetical protein
LERRDILEELDGFCLGPASGFIKINLPGTYYATKRVMAQVTNQEVSPCSSHV